MKKCACCGEDFDKLVKAHIIPQSFYRNIGKGKYVNTFKNNFSKRVRIGLYDKNILCDKCEKKYAFLDDYAKKLLIDDIEKYYKYPFIYVIPKENYDYDKIKKFFIFMLWRMSVSKLENFEKIKLGKYEHIAYQMFSGEIPLDENIFIILLRRNPKNSVLHNLYSFSEHKFDNTTRYELIFEEYSCSIILEYDINYFKNLQENLHIALLKNQDWAFMEWEITMPNLKKILLNRYIDNM